MKHVAIIEVYNKCKSSAGGPPYICVRPSSPTFKAEAILTAYKYNAGSNNSTDMLAAFKRSVFKFVTAFPKIIHIPRPAVYSQDLEYDEILSKVETMVYCSVYLLLLSINKVIQSTV
jgi:hypothetical protein